MATSIMLLDCTDDLAKRLRALGHEVYVGTTGHCNNLQKLSCQIYETDLVIFNPATISKVSLLQAKPVNQSPEIDFSYEAILSHLGDRGHWLVFLNRLTDNLILQQRLYSWLPTKPALQLTLDQKIKRPREMPPYMDKFTPLIDSPRSVQIRQPVRLKLTGADLRYQSGAGAFLPLVENYRSEYLAGVVSLFYGTMTFLPSCENNDDAAVFFLDYVWPNLMPKAARGGLAEEFLSPAENDIEAEIRKLRETFNSTQNAYHGLQTKGSEARQAKLAKITGDETAQRILGYYRDAEEDQKNVHAHLYKVRDAISNRYSNDTAAKAALVDCNAEWNLLGLLTNAPSKDARHAPKPGEPVQLLSAGDVQKLFAAAKKMILAYFGTLF